MSLSDDVMQKNSDETPVIWREYEALRDHSNVELKVDETDVTVKALQTQLTALQASLETLTQSVNAIRVALEQPHQDEFDDAGSIHNDNAEHLGHVHGRGIGHGRGLGFAP